MATVEAGGRIVQGVDHDEPGGRCLAGEHGGAQCVSQEAGAEPLSLLLLGNRQAGQDHRSYGVAGHPPHQ